MKLFLCFPLVYLFVLSSNVSALELFASAKPQSTKDTCQSYSPILALAALSDPAFPVDNFSRLRELELEFRRILEDIAGDNTTSHVYWPKAMEQLTGGAYTLDISYVADLVEYIEHIRKNTYLSDSLGSLIGQISGQPFQTVMTSVFSFDGSNYKKGHIITVLGVKGSGVNSNTQLIAFNSAIKEKNKPAIQCPSDYQPGDDEYTAGVISSTSFLPKAFSGLGYLVMTVKKK